MKGIRVALGALLATLVLASVALAQPAQKAGPKPLPVAGAGYVACKSDRAWLELEAIKANGKAWLAEIELKEKERMCVRTLAGDVLWAGPPNVYLPEAVAVIFIGRPDAPEQIAWFIHHEALPAVDSAFWTRAPVEAKQ
jgi:hypothetical protein